MMYGAPVANTGGDLGEENNSDFYGGINNNANARPRFPGLYVGNLTWWTTDQDVINLINSIGVSDVQEVKFFENRSNGQSKGFCVVTFGSEASLSSVMDKLPKLELHGQNPVVTPYNRQNLNLFESQTKTRPQINSNNGPNSHATGIMGISSISGVHSGTQGLPYSGLNQGGYNQGGGGPGMGGGGGPRGMPYHNNMQMRMRAPMRPMMRGSMPNAMNNGPIIPGGGHQPRMRFMQPQAWNNSSQGPYNSGPRMPQASLDPMSARIGNSGKPAEDSSQDMMSSQSTYYTPHHPSNSSQSDMYRGELREHRDLRDGHRDRDRERDRDRDERGSSTRRLDDRPSLPDDRSVRHDDRSLRHQDDRSAKPDERSSSRRSGEERTSRREDGGGSSSRREDGGSSSNRRAEERSSSRRDDKASSSSSRREKSHRSSDDRVRSRSRDRSRDRSRERKERRERRDRY